MSIIALIPARSGSKRVPSKNIRPLSGHPLIAYTIQAAIDSRIFTHVCCSTNDSTIGTIAQHYGATWIPRPDEFAVDHSPDIEWIVQSLGWIEKECIYDKGPDFFAILRPTSPFRTADTIIRAWEEYRPGTWMKAMEPVSQHPHKMWKIYHKYAWSNSPLSKISNHSLPTQLLPEYYVQNGALEIRPCSNPEPFENVQPFLTQGAEGLDINTEYDWILAEALHVKGIAALPEVRREPWK